MSETELFMFWVYEIATGKTVAHIEAPTDDQAISIASTRYGYKYEDLSTKAYDIVGGDPSRVRKTP